MVRALPRILPGLAHLQLSSRAGGRAARFDSACGAVAVRTSPASANLLLMLCLGLPHPSQAMELFSNLWSSAPEVLSAPTAADAQIAELTKLAQSLATQLFHKSEEVSEQGWEGLS